MQENALIFQIAMVASAENTLKFHLHPIEWIAEHSTVCKSVCWIYFWLTLWMHHNLIAIASNNILRWDFKIAASFYSHNRRQKNKKTKWIQIMHFFPNSYFQISISFIDLWNKYFGLSQFVDDIHILDQINNGDIKLQLSSATASANGQSKVFSCIKCGRRYSTRSIMLRHMNHECGMAKKYMCPKCNKKFRRKWNLEQHLKRIHATDWLLSTLLKSFFFKKKKKKLTKISFVQ